MQIQTQQRPFVICSHHLPSMLSFQFCQDQEINTQKLIRLGQLKKNLCKHIAQQNLNCVIYISQIHSFIYQNPYLALQVTIQISMIFQQLIGRLKIILQKINELSNNSERKKLEQIANSIIFLVSTMLITENNYLKGNGATKIWVSKIIHSEILFVILKTTFIEKKKQILKPIGLILGNLSQQKFSPDAKIFFKNYLLSTIHQIQQPKLKYWFLLSLHRLVTQAQVTTQQFLKFNIIKILINCLSINNLSLQMKYYLKIMACIAISHPQLILVFYQNGLSQKLKQLCKINSKIVYNFLQKMHGNNFKGYFPQDLLKFFMNKILYENFHQYQDLIKISLKILRYKLFNFQINQFVFFYAIQNGIIQKLCILSKINIFRIKYLVYMVIKNLIEYSKKKANRFSSLIIKKFQEQNLTSSLLIDLRNQFQDIRHIAIQIQFYFI